MWRRHTKYLSTRDKSEQSSLLSITFLWVGFELSVLVNVLLNELSLRVPCHYSVLWLGNLMYVLLLLLRGGTHWPTLRNIFKFYPICCFNRARQGEREGGRVRAARTVTPRCHCLCCCFYCCCCCRSSSLPPPFAFYFTLFGFWVEWLWTTCAQKNKKKIKSVTADSGRERKRWRGRESETLNPPKCRQLMDAKFSWSRRE